MTFLNCLKEDKYFQTLFPSVPAIENFEFHKINVDFQNGRLTLILHTPLLPEKIPAKDQGQKFNFSALEINFFFINDLILTQPGKQVETITLICDTEKKRIEGRLNKEVILSFSYDLAKLEKWTLYLNEP